MKGVKRIRRDPPKRGGRARLLATARELFTRHGASNVGINDVTDAAGVARMTLYNNFPSKEALIVAVYEEMAEGTLRGLRDIEITGRSEDERIRAVFDHFKIKTKEAKYRGCPFIHASLQTAEADGAIYALVQHYKRALRKHVFDVLDEHRSNRAELADQIVILLDGAVIEAYLKGVTNPGHAAQRAAATLLQIKE